jgi:predicted dehydrogenase
MEVQRVYLVGAGNIGRSHAGAVQGWDDSIDVKLFAADPDPDARAAFRDEFPAATLYDDSSEMLAEPAADTDIVVIGTPPFLHAPLAIEALESGRHVLCEKPLATSVAEAQEMVSVAESNDRLLGDCSCRHRGKPTTEKVRELVESAIGDVYHVNFIQRQQRGRAGIEYQPESKWFLDSSRAGGGVLLDWGMYDFGILHDVLPATELEVCQGWQASPETDVDPDTIFDVETIGGAALRYTTEDGSYIPVTYERGQCVHGEARTIFEIEGTRGSVAWNWVDGENVVRYFDEDGSVTSETHTFSLSQWRGNATPLTYFRQRILGEPAPISLNREAVVNFECIHAIYDAIESGERQRVDLETESIGRSPPRGEP